MTKQGWRREITTQRDLVFHFSANATIALWQSRKEREEADVAHQRKQRGATYAIERVRLLLRKMAERTGLDLGKSARCSSL